MSKPLLAGAFLAALLAAASGAAFGADGGQPPSGSPERGRDLYMKNQCYSCHGTAGQGGERGAGPRLAPNPFPYAAFEMQVRQPRGVMPRYPQQFVSAQDLADIYAYIAGIERGPAAKDIPLLNRF
ncbi:Cytochrome c, mono- and diheme variants [Noviherbaspirillum humi]|uniref:Cytochrome c, mono- and diheme variants n=2 Tax=Noviherbaspirillum humi TaxID=1688639 RepID=A0A239IMX7_9BURK|nr:Cytochrome c, mono- and diheme variants [Noviherbaspirillum humi]